MAKRWPPKRWTPHNVPSNYRDAVRAIVEADFDWGAADKDKAIAFADKVAAEGMRLEILIVPLPEASREMRNIFWGNIAFRRMYKDHFGHLPKPLGRRRGRLSKPHDEKGADRSQRYRDRKRSRSGVA
jgi:hypothetical protein